MEIFLINDIFLSQLFSGKWLGCKTRTGCFDSDDTELACEAGFGCHFCEGYVPGLVVEITVFVVCDAVQSGGN
jgi:hypothetical protein